MYYNLGMPCHGYFGIGGGGFWIMGIFGLAILLIVLYFIYQNNKGKNNDHNLSNNYKNPNRQALEILGKKFANGEISEEEYHRKRKVLESYK